MGRKPLYPQKYHNVGKMDTFRTTTKCKYYQGNSSEFIQCNHLYLSRDDYDLDDDCTNNYEDCPQYKLLEFWNNEQDRREIEGILAKLKDEVWSGKR